MPPAVLRAAAIWGHQPLLIRAQSIIQIEDFRSESSSETKDLSSDSPDLQGARESMPPNLEHFYVVATVRHHVDILRKSIHALEARSVIVFLNHSRRLKDVQFKLEARGLTAGTHFVLPFLIFIQHTILDSVFFWIPQVWSSNCIIFHVRL